LRFADPAGQRDGAVVSQDVVIERVQCRVVDIRFEDAFAQVVEHQDTRGATRPAEGCLVQLAPGLGTRLRHEQADRLAAEAERHDEEPNPAILAGARVPHHRAVSVIAPGFSAGRGLDDHARFR
jgi:hypothetical protein